MEPREADQTRHKEIERERQGVIQDKWKQHHESYREQHKPYYPSRHKFAGTPKIKAHCGQVFLFSMAEIYVY